MSKKKTASASGHRSSSDKPATKRDLKDLATKNDAQNLEAKLRTEMKHHMTAMETRILLHFDTALDHFRADLRTINIEKIQEHDARLTRLELHTGIIRSA